jgi:hypothetical protein
VPDGGLADLGALGNLFHGQVAQRPHRNRATGLNEPLSVRLPTIRELAEFPEQGRVSRYRSDRITLSETRESLCRKCF